MHGADGRKRRIGRGGILAAGLLSLLPLMSAPAMAGGFAIREQSAEFQGSSFAGNAAGGAGLSSMFWNPAAVTLHDGFRSDENVAIIIPHSKADNERSAGGIPAALLGFSGDSGNIGRTAAVPASYSSFRLNERIWLGLGMNAPFGMKTRNDANSLGALYGYESEITTININPVVGFRLNDWISIGAGLQIAYMDGDLSTVNRGVLTSRVKGDDWGVGFTVGLLLQPTESTRIGIGYRSRVKHTLKGDFLLSVYGYLLRDSARVKHTLPDMLTLSVRQQLGDRLALMGTVEWTNWSLFRNFTVNTPTLGSFTTAYNWRDSWMVAVGGEYRLNDSLTLRAGYAYERSPVPDSTRGVRVPDNDRHWVSVGLSFRAADWITLHAGYSHLFVKDGSVNIAADPGFPTPGTRPGLLADYKQNINIVALSATIDTGLFLSRLGGGNR